MNTYTFEKIRSVISKKGYHIESLGDLPDWKGRTLVRLTPEQARNVIEYDGQLVRSRLSSTINTHVDACIKDGTWSPDMGEVQLRSDYKVWRGMRILEAIAAQNHPVDVYINVLSDDRFSSSQDDSTVCSAIKNAVKELMAENGKELPELDDTIWESSLPQKLPNFDITIRSTGTDISVSEHPTIVGVLSENRTSEYSDMLFILRGNSQSGEATGYSCNLMPAVGYDYPLVLVPGMYEDLFAPETDFSCLVQATQAPLFTPKIRDGKIESYEQTSFKFMRISIPVKEPDNGIIPVGAVFENDSVKDQFLTDMSLVGVQKNVSLILLEEKDFR